MDRSAIHLLRKRGKSLRAIAAELGHSKTTVARALSEPVDQSAPHRQRVSRVDPWRAQIAEWPYELIAGRDERRPTLITSNKSLTEWAAIVHMPAWRPRSSIGFCTTARCSTGAGLHGESRVVVLTANSQPSPRTVLRLRCPTHLRASTPPHP